MDVTITVTPTAMRVDSPYDPDFRSRAEKIGGTWKDGAWEFDLRSEAAVRQLCRDIYGTDGSDNHQPRVTVRIPLDGVHSAEYRPAGETLVYRRARDQPVRFAKHVVLVAGDFPRSGGSMQYPALSPEPGTVIEVRDLAPGAAQLILDNDPDASVVDPGQADPRAQAAALREEKTRLLDRLTAIDQALAHLDAAVPG